MINLKLLFLISSVFICRPLTWAGNGIEELTGEIILGRNNH